MKQLLSKLLPIPIQAEQLKGKLCTILPKDGIPYTGIVEDISKAGLCLKGKTSIMVCPLTYGISYTQTKTVDHLILEHQGIKYKVFFK